MPVATFYALIFTVTTIDSFFIYKSCWTVATLAALLLLRWMRTWKGTGSENVKCFVLAHRSSHKMQCDFYRGFKEWLENSNNMNAAPMRSASSSYGRPFPLEMTTDLERSLCLSYHHHHHHLLLHHKGSTRYIYVHTPKIQLRNAEYKSTRIAQ